MGLAGPCPTRPQRGAGDRWRPSGRFARPFGSVARLLSATMDQPHLVEGLDRISRGLGGLARQWWFDRMATFCPQAPAGSAPPSPASRSTTG